MTYRMRRSPDFSLASSSSATDTPNYKNHHRIIHQENTDDDDDYADFSQSQSLYGTEEEDEEEDDEQPTNANESGDEFSSIVSKSNHQSNTFDAIASLNSAPNSTQSSSYINIAPLPTFHGTPDECPVTHLSRFTKVCRANNVPTDDMVVRIFPVTLEDEAALWYDLNIEPYPLLSWEEIKASFLEAYKRNYEIVDKFRSELKMINQGSDESVRAYFLRLQWILKRWPDHGLPNNLLKGIFVDGLKEDFQDWIIPQNPNSLEEALRLAFTWEQVQSIRVGRRKDLKCGFCDGTHEETECEIRRRMREIWIKNKERQLLRVSSLSRTESAEDGKGKELGRSVSMGTSSFNVDGKEDVGDEKDEGSKRKSNQCQCWKHQCWKKKLERNNSLVSRNSNAG